MSSSQATTQLRISEQRLHEFLIAEQIAIHRSVNFPQQLSQRFRGPRRDPIQTRRRVPISLRSNHGNNHEPNFAARLGTSIAGLTIGHLTQVPEYKVANLVTSSNSSLSSIFSGDDNCSIHLGTAALSVPLIVMRMHRRQERRHQREDEEFRRRVAEIRERVPREFAHESIQFQAQEILRRVTEVMDAHYARRYSRPRRVPARG